MQGPEERPKAPLGNNLRPVQSLHHRTIRTNIDFKHTKVRHKFSAPTTFSNKSFCSFFSIQGPQFLSNNAKEKPL